jgi:diphosphomevalonate decarboxylase
MKATAVAPANIAFIKYWGKADEKLRLPLNASLSMNLSACTTTTTVEFSPEFTDDRVSDGFDKKRIITHIDRLRKAAGIGLRATISTKNSFPTSSGVASSASGFAALTVAAAAALSLERTEKELTMFARLGSGSACRSIPDGFVEWKKREMHETSYAYSLYPHDYWDLRDILVIVDAGMKKVPTTEGMSAVRTSPFFPARLAALPGRIACIKEAMKQKNFQQFGEIVEEECLDMHHVMQTQNPPLYYWNNVTQEIMDAVAGWRKNGISVYFTIDAGPNVHLICEGKDEQRAIKAIQGMKGIKEIIVNKPSRGAHVL